MLLPLQGVVWLLHFTQGAALGYLRHCAFSAPLIQTLGYNYSDIALSAPLIQTLGYNYSDTALSARR